MTPYSLSNLIYALLVGTIILLPFAAYYLRPADSGKANLPPVGLTMVIICAVALLLTFARPTPLPLFMVVLLVPLIGRHWAALLGGAAALLLFLPAYWWGSPQTAPLAAIGIFILLALAVGWLHRPGTNVTVLNLPTPPGLVFSNMRTSCANT